MASNDSVNLTLGEIARELGVSVTEHSDLPVTGLGTIQSAGEGDLTFLANPRYRGYLRDTRASAVIVPIGYANESPVPALEVKDPYLAFARVSRHFDRTPLATPGIHPAAVVSPEATVDASAAIGPNVVVEPGARIGAGAVIRANAYVGHGAELGDQVRIAPNVTIYHGVRIGPRTIIHAGCVIGGDGFGFAFDGKGWQKVSQVGSVRIGSDVDIGAGTTIDRGAIEDTVIGNGVIIDNQVQVAHNVVIGDHTALAGCVGIAGSARIGSYCMLGGGVGVAGHLEITDRVHVLGMTLVSGSIREPGVYGSGMPADKQGRWRRNTARFRHLDELFRRVGALEKKFSDD